MGGTTNLTLNAKGTVKYDKNSIFSVKYTVKTVIDMILYEYYRNFYFETAKKTITSIA